MKISILVIVFTGILDLVVGACTGGQSRTGTLVPANSDCESAAGKALGL
jgi:hypothetical protein